MNLILFDDVEWYSLLPLTYTRPVSEIRIGILTFSERWAILLSDSPSCITQGYLQDKYKYIIGKENIFINPSFFPTPELVEKVKTLSYGQCIYQEENLVACCCEKLEGFDGLEKIKLNTQLIHIVNPWDLFVNNAFALEFDFCLLTKNKFSQEISKTNGVINSSRIFLEEGAKVEYALLNASEGPIYVGKNAEIMEGAMIRGGLSLGQESKVNMGAKIYGATTIGPQCKVGGEVNNSIFFGYSNKSHDGFIGNSVIGEWCNLGANTNNSNLKNNYGFVKLWSFHEKKYQSTGLQFCGSFMGDHSKTAIDTKLNTGTSIGVSVNVFKSGFPDNYIPSFSWVGEKTEEFKFEKAIEIAEKVMQRRKIKISEIDKSVLKYISNNRI